MTSLLRFGRRALVCLGLVMLMPLRLSAQDEKTLVQQGMDAWYSGDYEKAIAVDTQALQLDPKDARALANRGNCYLVLRENDKAIADYDQALKYDPQNLVARDNLGSAYLYKRNFGRSLAIYESAIQDYPKDWKAYFIAAGILATCPQAEFRDGMKAVDYATKAWELTQGSIPITVDQLAAACAEAGDFDLAVKWESQYLATPNLGAQEIGYAKNRLALHKVHLPYHQTE